MLSLGDHADFLKANIVSALITILAEGGIIIESKHPICFGTEMQHPYCISHQGKLCLMEGLHAERRARVRMLASFQQFVSNKGDVNAKT